ncbi:Argininosuccinate lyase [Variovorax sp. SRS16]|uniref:tripartite tricarboxylate transporter substrate binding protein n=1 Tax=Variovorax sp. SRS16 TaxID=282217 RepID=UPI0013177F8C|nr:tripartite tricarboxylate transporter substrate binding protein [Variovorax sp. SRS16]VTU22390.1 Argininosuccinate lyase [Variovorax sp. SRS16]
MNLAKRILPALALALAVCAGHAQTYPSRPVRLVVPFPAGGGTDIVARRMAQHLHEELGQVFIIDNKSGASGNIGAESVARSAPDGYTLMLTAAPFAIAPALFKSLGFDPVKDFTPVAEVASVPLLVVTRADSPLKSIADLVAAAKKDGNAISYASFGNGSPPHLVGERMKALAGIGMTHVPYKGSQAALPDLLSGQVAVGILDVVSMTPLIKSGRLRALAITGPQRTPVLPDVPTLTQAGIPFDTVGWYAMFGPAGMDPAITARLNGAVNKVMARPDMRSLLLASGSLSVDPAPTAAQWAAAFKDNVQVWGEVARASGASVE